MKTTTRPAPPPLIKPSPAWWKRFPWTWGWKRRKTWRGDKFIILMNRYKVLAQVQQLKQPPAISVIFDRCPSPANLSALEYAARVTETITWSEVDLVEEAVIAIIPQAALVEQLRVQRLVYAGMVNSTEYDQYKSTMCSLELAGTTNGPSLDRVRSELLAVTQRIKYVLEQEPPKERARALLTLWNICIMLLATGVIVIAYTEVPWVRHQEITQTIVLVMVAGLLGGFISVQQRLQQPTNVDPLLKWLDLKTSGFSLLLSPVIGMVFAIVIFAIFAGGFISGTLVPSFGCDASINAGLCKEHNFAAFAVSSVPSASSDWAKLAVWAFAAGFLERLVPDILTRISATADVTNK